MSALRRTASRVRRRIGRWANPALAAELQETKRKLRSTRKALRETARPARRDRPSAAAGGRAHDRDGAQEHLTFLKETNLRELAAAVLDAESDRLAGLADRGRHGARRLGDRDGGREGSRPADEGLRRLRDDPAADRAGRPGRPRALREDHRRRGRGVGGDTYYGYRDDLYHEVTDSFARLGVPIGDHNVELIRGLFEDTIELDEPVSVAHLDGDWYESTMTCLTRIAPLLVPGGRIVLDDYYQWSGCRAAVDEYFSGRDGFRLERHAQLHVVRES